MLDHPHFENKMYHRNFEDGGGINHQRVPWSGRTYADPVKFWNPVGAATFRVDVSKPLSAQNRQCVRIEAPAGGGLANDGTVIVKVVNCAEEPQKVRLNLQGRTTKTVFTGPNRHAHNTPAEPDALKETVTELDFKGDDTLALLSLTIYRIRYPPNFRNASAFT